MTTERPDPIQKIRSLVDALRHHFDESRKPPKDQSIEEEMVSFKVRSVLKSTERSDDQKPAKNRPFQVSNFLTAVSQEGIPLSLRYTMELDLGKRKEDLVITRWWREWSLISVKPWQNEDM